MNRRWEADSTGVSWHLLPAPSGIWWEPCWRSHTLPACLPGEPCSCPMVFWSRDFFAFLWKRIKQELSQKLAGLQLFSQYSSRPAFIFFPLNRNVGEPKPRPYTSVQSHRIRTFCIFLINPETLQVFNFHFPESQDECKDKTCRAERHQREVSFKILMKLNLIYN